MSISKYLKSHAVLVSTITILLIITGIIAGRISKKNKIVVDSSSNVKQVSIVSVNNFRNDNSTISADGVVESISQVDIKSQVSSPVTKINISVGDNVYKGQIIMELQNADIQAQLEQARANLELAKGQYSSDGVVIDSNRKTVIDKIKDGYTKTNDVINAQIGQFLYSGNPNIIQLQSLIIDSDIVNKLSTNWTESLSALRDWKISIDTLSEKSTQAEVDKALSIAQKSILKVSNFIDILSDALINVANISNQTTMNLVSGWKSTATLARTTVNATISSITSSGYSIVSNQAQILSAEAGLKNLQAQLAKTIIISPIDGKIASLPLRNGEFASPGQLLTTIIGSGGLQVKAYASGEDLERIKKNADVIIQDNIKGSVINVSPGVNQINKKVEIKIAIKDSDKSGLIVGQNVKAMIKADNIISSDLGKDSYIIPIQNVKIVPGSAYVFTVDENSKIVKNEVTLGEIKGDFVEIKSGITEDMKIVSPVYELEEGEKVTVE